MDRQNAIRNQHSTIRTGVGRFSLDSGLIKTKYVFCIANVLRVVFFFLILVWVPPKAEPETKVDV